MIISQQAHHAAILENRLAIIIDYRRPSAVWWIYGTIPINVHSCITPPPRITRVRILALDAGRLRLEWAIDW